MLKISRISNYNEFKIYSERWQDILSRSKISNVFLTYDWIGACIKHFHEHDRLLILNVFDNERLVGIAPLMIKKYKWFGLPVKTVFFIGTSISDRMDFILDGNK